MTAARARAFVTDRVATCALALACGLSLTVSACASSNGERMQKNVATFQSEEKPERLVRLGKGFASVGDLTRAEQYFSMALAQGGDEKQIMPLILAVCIQDQRYRSAIQYAEGFLRKHPEETPTRFVLATLYLGVGANSEAHQELERVIAARPDDAEAHFALATLMRDSEGDLVGADRHFREYLRLKPHGEHAEEAQGSLLHSVGGRSVGEAPKPVVPGGDGTKDAVSGSVGASTDEKSVNE